MGRRVEGVQIGLFAGFGAFRPTLLQSLAYKVVGEGTKITETATITQSAPLIKSTEQE